jgi:hypothetical protein
MDLEWVETRRVVRVVGRKRRECVLYGFVRVKEPEKGDFLNEIFRHRLEELCECLRVKLSDPMAAEQSVPNQFRKTRHLSRFHLDKIWPP